MAITRACGVTSAGRLDSVVVNGDVRSAADVARAMAERAMIGRAAIEHPWIFREARALLAGLPATAPTGAERVACYRALVIANTEARGEEFSIGMTRRHINVLGPLAATLEPVLFRAPTLATTTAVLDAV